MTVPGGEHTTEHQEPREVRVAESHSTAAGHGGSGAAAEQLAEAASAHERDTHGSDDHGAGGRDPGAHDAGGHGGHGGHGDEMTLGPIDMTAWIVGLAGVAIGLVVAFCFALSTGYLG